jgi:glycerophosphoryl diester phosphodiesterase
VHGHRGARAVLPENTLAGFQYAIAVGADAIEMDVAATLDDVPVISHDPWLRGGRPKIRELTFEDLRRRAPDIPTLEEVLALAPLGAFLFNIEIKSNPRRPALSPAPEPFAHLVLDAVLARGLADRAMVQSFDFRVLRAARRQAPQLALGALFARASADFATLARRAEASIAVPYYRLATRRRVEAAHQAGVPVYVWTVNGPFAWRRQIAAGVDAIITDDPAGLIQFLRSPATPAP